VKVGIGSLPPSASAGATASTAARARATTITTCGGLIWKRNSTLASSLLHLLVVLRTYTLTLSIGAGLTDSFAILITLLLRHHLTAIDTILVTLLNAILGLILCPLWISHSLRKGGQRCQHRCGHGYGGDQVVMLINHLKLPLT
jgi:hypothetical protein